MMARWSTTGFPQRPSRGSEPAECQTGRARVVSRGSHGDEEPLPRRVPSDPTRAPRRSLHASPGARAEIRVGGPQRGRPAVDEGLLEGLRGNRRGDWLLGPPAPEHEHQGRRLRRQLVEDERPGQALEPGPRRRSREGSQAPQVGALAHLAAVQVLDGRGRHRRLPEGRRSAPRLRGRGVGRLHG